MIPAGVRERLAVATAEANGCEYCLSAHTYIGANVAKVDAEEMERARSAESRDLHTAALLALSDAILVNAGDVDEAALREARALGVTDAEIGELVGHIALDVFTNYFNVRHRSTTTGPSSRHAPARPEPSTTGGSRVPVAAPRRDPRSTSSRSTERSTRLQQAGSLREVVAGGDHEVWVRLKAGQRRR